MDYFLPKILYDEIFANIGVYADVSRLIFEFLPDMVKKQFIIFNRHSTRSYIIMR